MPRYSTSDRVLLHSRSRTKGLRRTVPSPSELKDGEEVYVKVSDTLYLYTKQGGILWRVELSKAV